MKVRGAALAALVSIGAAAAPARAESVVASTYGWPFEGSAEETQPLAGCGYVRLVGKSAGTPLPCRLSRHARVVASRSLPLGSRVRVCWRSRCSWAWVADRGPYANGADVDLSYGLAWALRFPYSVESVEMAVR